MTERRGRSWKTHRRSKAVSYVGPLLAAFTGSQDRIAIRDVCAVVHIPFILLV